MFFEVFPTEVIWGKTKITRALIFYKGGEGKISETECFFHFAVFFVDIYIQTTKLSNSCKIFKI